MTKCSKVLTGSAMKWLSRDAFQEMCNDPLFVILCTTSSKFRHFVSQLQSPPLR